MFHGNLPLNAIARAVPPSVEIQIEYDDESDLMPQQSEHDAPMVKPDVCLETPTEWRTYATDMNKILACIASCCPAFVMPSSTLQITGVSTNFDIGNGSSALRFTQVDHGMLFHPIFSDRTSACDQQQREFSLQMAAMCEVHRCFFLHLGVALRLHPIALQSIFRNRSSVLLQCINLAMQLNDSEDDTRYDGLKLWDSSLISVMKH